MATTLYLTTKSPNARILGHQVDGVFDDYIERREHGQWNWTFLLDTDATDGGAIQTAAIVDKESLVVTGTTYRPQFPRSNVHPSAFRWCTKPLTAQTISGTYNHLIAAGSASGVSRVPYWKVYLYITVGDTPAVRHVLLDYEDSTNTIPSGVIRFDALDAAQTLTSGSALAGDRLMLVLGVRYQGTDVALNTPSTSVYYGTQLGTTGSPGSDGTLNGTAVTTEKGFVTFSHDLVFLADPAAPAHDACADAIVITSLPFTHECDTTQSADTNRAVWYRWTADATGTVILNTFGSNYRVNIAIMTGSCPSPSLVDNNSRAQWIQSSQALYVLNATASTTYFFRMTQTTGTNMSARNSGGFLRFQVSRRQSLQPNDLIINSQHIAVYRDGVLINITDKFYGDTPTGSSIDTTLRPIVSNIDSSIHTDLRLAVVLFGNDLVEYLDLDTLNHFNFSELTYIPLWEAEDYSGDKLSSIVWDSSGNIYLGFFGDNYSHLGNPPTNPQTAWIHKFDGAITTTNWPDDEAVLLARYDIELENQGSDYIELASDQRTMFYTSAGRKIFRYDVVDDVQLSLFATVAPEASPGPRPGLRGLRLLPPGDGSGGLLVTDGINVKRLNASGTVIQTYTPAESALAKDLDKIELSRDATQFYVTDQLSTTVFKFNVNSGAQLATYPLYLPQGQLCGFSTNDGYRAGVPTIGPPFEPPGPGPVDQSQLCPCPSPPSPTDPRGAVPVLLPTIPPPEFCTGGGLVPTAVDLVDSEVWWGL